MASTGTDGDYLVRTRNLDNGEFILCVVFRGKATHHLVKREGDGTLTVNNKPTGGARTMAQVIKYEGSTA